MDDGRSTGLQRSGVATPSSVFKRWVLPVADDLCRLCLFRRFRCWFRFLRMRDDRLGRGRRFGDHIVENDEAQGQSTYDDHHGARRRDPTSPAGSAISHGYLILIGRVDLAPRSPWIDKRQEAVFELLRGAGYVCVANSRMEGVVKNLTLLAGS